MNTTLLFLAIATFFSTYLGGLFALKFKDKSHLIVGFSAGAVIGLAFFDLLPESINLSIGYINIGFVCLMVAIGFLAYMILDRFFGVHSHGNLHEIHEHDHKDHEHRASIRAGSLSFHSLLDGVGIGLAFQASSALGIAVAVAVLGHDFCDGINTVTSVIKGGGRRARALRWLLIDALAPALGIIATVLFSVPDKYFSTILALFAGFFLYIGASDLVPESYHAHPTWKTTLATILGASFMFLVISLAG